MVNKLFRFTLFYPGHVAGIWVVGVFDCMAIGFPCPLRKSISQMADPGWLIRGIDYCDRDCIESKRKSKNTYALYYDEIIKTVSLFSFFRRYPEQFALQISYFAIYYFTGNGYGNIQFIGKKSHNMHYRVIRENVEELSLFFQFVRSPGA